MRSGEAKELICMTHGCELRWEDDGGRGHAERKKIKGGNGTTVVA